MKPDPEWYKEKHTPANAAWHTTLIKERDVSYKLPKGMKPHECDRWSIGGSDYVVKYEDVEHDIAVLHSSYSHLYFPISFKALGYGKQSRHSVGPSDFPDPESTGISCCRSVPALRSLKPGRVPVKSVYLS